MPNMSYCRFENTEAALDDCYEHMDLQYNELSESETEARERMIDLCVNIATEYGHEIDRECNEAD